jgi:hypothetical protein
VLGEGQERGRLGVVSTVTCSRSDPQMTGDSG